MLTPDRSTTYSSSGCAPRADIRRHRPTGADTMESNTKDDILKSIQLRGGISNTIDNPIVATKIHVDNLLNLSSGLPRFKNPAKFSLILSQPLALQALTPLSIRCCLCGRIISYPAWYHAVQYAVNSIHYFVCFDHNSPVKVNAECLRRK